MADADLGIFADLVPPKPGAGVTIKEAPITIGSRSVAAQDLPKPAPDFGMFADLVPKKAPAKDTFLSEGASQLAAGVPGAAKDIGGQIKSDFELGGGVRQLGEKEFGQGEHIKGIVNMIMGTGSQIMSPLTGLTEKIPDYIDPGMAPEGRELVPETVVPKIGKEALKSSPTPPSFPKPEGANVNVQTPPAPPKIAVGAPLPRPKSASAAAAKTAEILQGTIADREKLEKPPSLREHFHNAGQTIRAVLAPETLADKSAGQAAAGIRKALGTAARASEQAKATLDAFAPQTRAMDMQEKLDLIDYIQNRSRMNEPVDEVKPLVNTLRDIFESRQKELEALPKTEKMHFLEDYYPQQWKNPEAAKNFALNFGTKEGSAGFTKGRTIPTMADGIRAGLEPVTVDPIEGTLRYIENADRYIALNKAFEDAIADENVVWRFPGKQPEGWVKLNGRIRSYKGGGFEEAYAPKGFATVYNNFTSRRPEGAVGDILSTVQKGFNAVTAFKLGLSAFHATMMTQEAVVSGVASAIAELRGGRPFSAMKYLIGAPFRPLTSIMVSRQLTKAYLKDIGSPMMRKVAQLAAEANFRVVGKGKVADEYRFGGSDNLWRAFKRGSLKAEAAADLKEMKGSPLIGGTKVIAKNVGRVLNTLTAPLFDWYIPLIKNAAYFRGLERWLKANPTATEAEQVAYARKFADSIDNRFGEMNQDNIFWSKTQKMASQLALLSYSYTMGTAREIGGGAIDFAKAPVTGKWTDKMDYVIALPIVYGTINAMSQYLHTGKPPSSILDLAAPQTGGKDATTGQPERETWPSYMNNVLGFISDPRAELIHKLHPAWQVIGGVLSGNDWRGDPIAVSTDPMTQKVKSYLEFLASETLEPISVESQEQMKGGTMISPAERFMGARPANMALTSPKDFASMKQYQALQADALKAWHDHVTAEHAAGRQVKAGKQAFMHAYIAKHRNDVQIKPYGGVQ